MNFRRVILFIFFVLCSVCVEAQENLLFEAESWDFGDIREEDGSVSCRFTAENRSGQPVVILNVVGSCRCVSARFSRKPVLPGEKTQITVTFDPLGRPGTFSKDMGVYTSDRRKAATLTVTGNVLPRPKSLGELYPVDAGGGLRLQTNLCSFSYMYLGHETHASIGCVNTSREPIRLELRPQRVSPELTLTAPRVIAPGARESIDFGYLFPTDRPRYGTVNDVWEVWVDGKNRKLLVVTHGIVVDNPARQDKNLMPKGNISENIVKFVFDKHKTDVLRRRLTLSNTGRGALIVRAVEHGGVFSTELEAGTVIPAGESREFGITLDPRQCPSASCTDRLILITNDPLRPMIRVRMTAVRL